MSFISEKYYKEKLLKNNINIKTQYIVGNEILERNTNTDNNVDIKSGIICKKEYYHNDKLLHTEKDFDSRIEYSYIKGNLYDEYKCPNCGMTSSLKDFIDGCPYCGTHYNLDYSEKDLGSKYHYDRVLKSPTYKIITAIIDLIISLILCFIFIKSTSRTFNTYDISKIFIYGSILAIILYYFFYLADAYVVLGPIKRYKDRENQKQRDFWNKTKLDKKSFYNNLNYEIRKKYYSIEDIIDYDILDYLNFHDYTKENKLYVDITIEIRVVYFKKNKISSKIIKDKYTLKKHDNGTLELKDGANIIKCHNCGASIDATKEKCEYCNSEIKYLQDWILEE